MLLLGFFRFLVMCIFCDLLGYSCSFASSAQVMNLFIDFCKYFLDCLHNFEEPSFVVSKVYLIMLVFGKLVGISTLKSWWIELLLAEFMSYFFSCSNC